MKPVVGHRGYPAITRDRERAVRGGGRQECGVHRRGTDLQYRGQYAGGEK